MDWFLQSTWRQIPLFSQQARHFVNPPSPIPPDSDDFTESTDDVLGSPTDSESSQAGLSTSGEAAENEKLEPAHEQPNDWLAVVGIGSSAGGLEALQEFFRELPADTGMAFVVLTHQHPGHVSMLPDLLGRETSLPVEQAHDGTKLSANRVYISPSEGQLSIVNGTLQQMELDRKVRPSMPIDYFFRSLAFDQQSKAIGVILSGTGTDGTVGLKSIKAVTGMVMVQQPQSAKYAGTRARLPRGWLITFFLRLRCRNSSRRTSMDHICAVRRHSLRFRQFRKTRCNRSSACCAKSRDTIFPTTNGTLLAGGSNAG